MIIRKIKMAVGKDDESGEDIMRPVHIEKINNGFIVRVCGGSPKEIEFVKGLQDTPKVLAKLLGVEDDVTSSELEKNVKFESDEESED